VSGQPVTVVVPARNAARTIARAIASVDSPLAHEIVLVDHASTDDTIARARAVARRPLRVVQAPQSARLGGVRGIGLAAVDTPYSVSLDADDELLPGRVERLVAALDGGADIALDEAEIVPFDGRGPATVARIPGWLRHTSAPVRLFERNYLPAPGPIGARVDAVRTVGYDAELHGPEDTDLLLRALRSGLRFALVTEVGYRIHASPGSISRQRANQRAMYARLLCKHDPVAVGRLYAEAGVPHEITQWGLISFFMFRNEPAAALALVETLATESAGDMILEPTGPCPRPESWRIAFHRGTLALTLGDAESACRHLKAANTIEETTEGWNNLGAALRRLGRAGEAEAAFGQALRRWPDYADARENLADPDATSVTLHPLRVTVSRNDYTPETPPTTLRPAREAIHVL
jgi:glycosyltransferase involved in cell wall biosynthesis